MAELVDALVSGTSVRKYVQVRVLFWAPLKIEAFVIQQIAGALFFGGIVGGRMISVSCHFSPLISPYIDFLSPGYGIYHLNHFDGFIPAISRSRVLPHKLRY